MSQLDDGTGTSRKAKVDGNNRLHTKSITITTDKDASQRGGSYNLNTGLITLTDDAETPIMYLKNNEDEDLHIYAIAVGTYSATLSSGSASSVTIRITRNPTGGTIVSSPTDADIKSNRNFGSAKTITADVYKGATGDTMTGDADHIIFRHSSASRLFAGIDEVIPKGSSLGITLAAPTNNTSMQCYAALICHLGDENE